MGTGYGYNPFTNKLDGTDADFVDAANVSWKIEYVFDDVTERDLFFTNNPSLLREDTLIVIKDTTPPPTPGVRQLEFNRSYNSQYKVLLYP